LESAQQHFGQMPFGQVTCNRRVPIKSSPPAWMLSLMPAV